jgi:hypothetical protein
MPNPWVSLRCDQLIPVNKAVNKKELLEKWLRLGRACKMWAWAWFAGSDVWTAGLAQKTGPHGLGLLFYVVKAWARMSGLGLGPTRPGLKKGWRKKKNLPAAADANPTLGSSAPSAIGSSPRRSVGTRRRISSGRRTPWIDFMKLKVSNSTKLMLIIFSD